MTSIPPMIGIEAIILRRTHISFYRTLQIKFLSSQRLHTTVIYLRVFSRLQIRLSTYTWLSAKIILMTHVVDLTIRHCDVKVYSTALIALTKISIRTKCEIFEVHWHH